MNRYKKVIRIIETLLNICIVVLSLPTRFTKQPKVKISKNQIHILGNGPSLKDDIQQIKVEKSGGASFMAVNAFATTVLFEQIQPELYILVDPAFFEESVTGDIHAIQKNVISALNNKTKWPLSIILPAKAKNKKFVAEIEKNENIKCFFINNIPVIGGNLSVNSFLFEYGLANPLFQNVLIAAIYYCIKIGYKKIVLWGADHSWHEDFILGTDNVIYTPDKHFYGSLGMRKHVDEYGRHVKVHEEFGSLQKTFEAYHTLSFFALKTNTVILNKSKKTWIDAFQRS